ncbi:S9 family peptidase [Bacillus sp. BGMRC 2118]|nr:S9 family peptidase [Bacillus sp. BGMRC 2118]
MKRNEHTYLNIQELLSIPTLSSLHISEDGQNVAFVKTTADWNNNVYRNHIWTYERNKGQCYALRNDIEGISPLWSPDSRYLAYVRSVDGENQIFIESLVGGSRVQITDVEEGVSTFKWDPAGKGVYYLAPSKESENSKNRKEMYGDFQHIGKAYQNHCLYYIELANDMKISKYQLTDGNDFHIQEFDISPNGEQVVLLATPSSNREDEQNGELFLLDPKTKTLHKLEGNKVVGGSLCFSPDGTKLCYTASLLEKEHYQSHIRDSTVEIYHLTSGERKQPLSDFDSTVTPLRWTTQGILIMWQDQTNYLIGLLSEDGSVEMLSETENCCTMDASITLNGEHLSYSKAMTNETFEVYFDNQKITNENHIFIGRHTCKREVISWKSNDGLEIEGVLSKPVNFDSTKKYPLLVLIHGGPNWASFPIHSGCFNEKYPVEQFIEKGFIVIEPNYRGSTGYGNEFLKANYRKLGIGDYDDVISGVDYLVDKGMADNDRVGVMGWSQGGYISAFCSTYSDRFKAISVGGGITNWMTYYTNTNLPQFTRMYLGDTPWNDPEIYAKTSPMNYIRSACTPTLIQHGEMDKGVPTPNAYELYRGLRDQKVETELVIFKGMGYSANQPGVNLAIMNQNLMWFSHYILEESLNDFQAL